jgi:type II secretory pathway component PulJ
MLCVHNAVSFDGLSIRDCNLEFLQRLFFKLLGHHNTQTNTTQYVLDTTILKQTQHNMCWTPQYSNKHNTICAGHHYAQTNTTQYVLDTTILKQTQHNMCWTPLYSNKHNTICAGHHYTQTNTTKYVLDTTILKQTQVSSTYCVVFV